MADVQYAVPEWPYALSRPQARGIIKQQPDDFIVSEQLPFEPMGRGEHVYLRIEKTGENTDYVVRQLARVAAVRTRDVGYAGLKDRHGRTTQWFSVWLPGRPEPDWSVFANTPIKVLQTERHDRKLKRGALAGNHFHIRVRQWTGDPVQAELRLQNIRSQGFPNYFTEQRFGRNGDNVNQALALFAAGRLRPPRSGIYYSAVRAYLFNHQLAERVGRQTWNVPVSGDICMLNGSHSVFAIDHSDEVLFARAAAGDIHPAGLLPGLLATKQLLQPDAIWQNGEFAPLLELLTASGLTASYRAYRTLPQQLTWKFLADDVLDLQFSLPSGSYATALLRELVAT